MKLDIDTRHFINQYKIKHEINNEEKSTIHMTKDNAMVAKLIVNPDVQKPLEYSSGEEFCLSRLDHQNIVKLLDSHQVKDFSHDTFGSILIMEMYVCNIDRMEGIF